MTLPFADARKLADDARAMALDPCQALSIAAVFTGNLASATRFLEEAEAGQVAVDLPTAGWDVHHPFGGFHQSGSLFKEQGGSGLRFYSRIETTVVRYQC